MWRLRLMILRTRKTRREKKIEFINEGAELEYEQDQRVPQPAFSAEEDELDIDEIERRVRERYKGPTTHLTLRMEMMCSSKPFSPPSVTPNCSGLGLHKSGLGLHKSGLGF